MADISTFTLDNKPLPTANRKRIYLTDQQKAEWIDKVQKSINEKIPAEMLNENNYAKQKEVRDILVGIMKEHNINDYVIVCDKSNNTDEVIKQRAFIADILMKLDDTPGGSNIRLEYRPSPFDTIKGQHELDNVRRNRELPPNNFPGGNPFAR